jgi:hypothetical protein
VFKLFNQNLRPFSLEEIRLGTDPSSAFASDHVQIVSEEPDLRACHLGFTGLGQGTTELIVHLEIFVLMVISSPVEVYLQVVKGFNLLIVQVSYLQIDSIPVFFLGTFDGVSLAEFKLVLSKGQREGVELSTGVFSFGMFCFGHVDVESGHVLGFVNDVGKVHGVLGALPVVCNPLTLRLLL